MRKQKTNSNPSCGAYMMPDIAYLFVMDRMRGTNRAIAESTFGHLVSTTEDARKERRAVAAACKVCIEINGNTQRDVLHADLYRKTALPLGGT